MGSLEQTKKGNLTIEGSLTTGSFKMTTGAVANKILTTNDSGVATWQTPATVDTSAAGETGYVQFNDDGVFAATSTFFWDNINKRLGIGTTTPQTKLDVAGAIKIGTQDTCDANSAGAIRYDSTVKKFYGCNGTSWMSLEQQSCGYAVTFTYKGSTVTYGTVYNPSTGRCWMDRNLGALRVATSLTDDNAYGDLFQWGRLADGHQTRTSGTTATFSSTDNPGHSNFILSSASPYDWRSPQNNNLWQGVSGINNPCPTGWRIPIESEWEAERLSWTGGNNYNGAFASPLKLTAGGYRSSSSGQLSFVGSYAYYWSCTVAGTAARCLGLGSNEALLVGGSRAYSFSVRCVQD